MLQPTDETPLLGAHHYQRHPRCYTIAYMLLLVACLLCNLVPLVSLNILESIFSLKNSVPLQLAVFMVPDFFQRVFLPCIGQVLDYSSYLSLASLDDRLRRRAIRKSDSINAILKAGMLKIPPTTVTTILALRKAGLSFWLSSLLTTLYLALIALTAYIAFTPLAKVIQVRRSTRDDSVYDFPLLDLPT